MTVSSIFRRRAFLFTPFNVLPYMAGEILWRACTFGLFVYALKRLHAFFLAASSPWPARTFLFLALLAVPSSFASLRNAQFDLPLAALIVLTAAEVAAERWGTAALWLCLAVALKPLGAAVALLRALLAVDSARARGTCHRLRAAVPALESQLCRSGISPLLRDADPGVTGR